MTSKMLLAGVTLLCMGLFASNSILCRAALLEYGMDPGLYTAVRGFSAAAGLYVLAWWHLRRMPPERKQKSFAGSRGSRAGALSLFAYMAFFSWGYVNMPAAAGTLIINASVQFGMVGWGMRHGVRPGVRQLFCLGIAMTGLVGLLLPGLDAPPLTGALLMIGTGLAWSAYSICGRQGGDPVLTTAGNFWRCVPLAALAGAAGLMTGGTAHPVALLYAIGAGAGASACGYVLWYMVVPCYSLVNAAIIQLSVPVITAVLALLTLDEAVTLRFVLCAGLILGGIALSLPGNGQEGRERHGSRDGA